MRELTDFDEALLSSVLEPILISLNDRAIFEAAEKRNPESLADALTDYQVSLALGCYKAGFIEGARNTRFL